MKFVAELMKLTSDIQERKAGVRLAAAVHEADWVNAAATKRLLGRMAGGRPTIFDSVEKIDTAGEMDLMMTIVSLNGKATPVVGVDVQKTTELLPLEPQLEGTIKPVPRIRIARDTTINKVRLWLLHLSKGALVTSMELKDRFSLNDGTVCSIVDNLLEDRVVRRKRNITGSFKRGTFVRLGKSCEATLKRRLRGKRIS